MFFRFNPAMCPRSLSLADYISAAIFFISMTVRAWKRGRDGCNKKYSSLCLATSFLPLLALDGLFFKRSCLSALQERTSTAPVHTSTSVLGALHFSRARWLLMICATVSSVISRKRCSTFSENPMPKKRTVQPYRFYAAWFSCTENLWLFHYNCRWYDWGKYGISTVFPFAYWTTFFVHIQFGSEQVGRNCKGVLINFFGSCLFLEFFIQVSSSVFPSQWLD